MTFRKWFGVTVASALLGALVGTSNGCSSSNNASGPGDASEDGPPVRHPDGSDIDTGLGGGGDDGGDAVATTPYDGTTGNPCTMDSQCKGTGAGAPGINKCTTDANIFTLGELFPTGVCIVPPQVPCDPCGGKTPCDNFIHGCDGPDGPSAPGVCLPRSNPAKVGDGICLPACAFKGDGSMPAGCQGKDACNAIAFDPTQTPPVGIGYCFGGCTADTDCVTGEKCDTTTGLCVKTVTPPTKNLGDGCNMMEANMMPPPCNCVYGTLSGLGFCTLFCTVGGSQCPSGWVCDAQEPTTLIGPNDASVPGFMTQNTGLAGFCVPQCGVDGGTIATDSGTCPTNTTCQTGSATGPVCVP
jgi:hypothetical protein